MPVIPFTAPAAPAGTGMEKSFVRPPEEMSYTLNCFTQFFVSFGEQAGFSLKS